MNFSYRIILPEKAEFGSKSDDGNWTGMVGQVFRNQLDFGKRLDAKTRDYIRALPKEFLIIHVDNNKKSNRLQNFHSNITVSFKNCL